MQRHRAADRLRYRPKLVDAVAMIAVGMGDDHPIEAADIGRKQLLAKVGTTIDEHAFAGAFDQDRSAQPSIARLIRIALAPLVPDLRDAGRRPAAEDPDLHAAAC